MKNATPVSLIVLVLHSLRVLARHGWAANSANNAEDMKGLTIAQLVELADTLHCLDGMSHSTMRKMGKAKLIGKILADIAPGN
jgi:hypothetical protein